MEKILKPKLGKCVTLFFLAMTIMMGSSICYGSEISTFCEVPSVGKGESTLLTCHFSENLHLSRNTIKITHYIATANGVQDTTVLLCQIVLDQTRCHTYPDYIFYGTITDKLSLVIPHAGEEHTGTYLCDVFYHDSGNDKECNFTLNDYNLKTSSAVSIIQAPESPDDNGRNQRTVMIIILASVLGALVVLLVAVIGVMIVYYRKRINRLLAARKEHDYFNNMFQLKQIISIRDM